MKSLTENEGLKLGRLVAPNGFGALKITFVTLKITSLDIYTHTCLTRYPLITQTFGMCACCFLNYNKRKNEDMIFPC